VIRIEVRAASALRYFALASRWIRLRAAAQLHRQVAAVGPCEVQERSLSLNAWWWRWSES